MWLYSWVADWVRRSQSPKCLIVVIQNLLPSYFYSPSKIVWGLNNVISKELVVSILLFSAFISKISPKTLLWNTIFYYLTMTNFPESHEAAQNNCNFDSKNYDEFTNGFSISSVSKLSVFNFDFLSVRKTLRGFRKMARKGKNNKINRYSFSLAILSLKFFTVDIISWHSIPLMTSYIRKTQKPIWKTFEQSRKTIERKRTKSTGCAVHFAAVRP